MDLITKFAAVEVKSDNRITTEDKKFCESHQAAYEAAKGSLTELQFFWEDILEKQNEILKDTDSKGTLYLTADSDLRISSEKIQEQLKTLHNIFIEQLVGYFNRLYSITISCPDIVNQLLPQNPERRSYDEKSLEQYKNEKAQYETDLLNLSLTFENILEQIFAQMDGRGLLEQALYELKEKCHSAVWPRYCKEPKYELHKNILRFTGYACSYNGRYRSSAWELNSGVKDVLRGIAHFETGNFSYIPHDISKLLGYSYDYDMAEFSSCQKVKQLKMFKNGRVDIKFADASLATKFVEEYLGTVY